MEPSHFSPHSKFFRIKQALVRERTLVALLVLSLFLVGLHVQAPLVFQILLGAWMSYATIHLLWKILRVVRLASSLPEPSQPPESTQRDLVTGLPSIQSLDIPSAMGQKSAPDPADGMVGVVLVGIDRLEGIKKDHGRTAGEEVRRKTARILLQEMRPSNLCAHWTDDEFIAIFPDISPTRLRALAEKLLGRIQVEFRETKHQATACIGIAFGEKVRAQELTGQAERALEKARQGGGNRVEVAP